MKGVSELLLKYTTITVRVGLGIVFLYSSADKILDPAGFAQIVANYRLLPTALANATAVVLPWIEAICGLALVTGRFEKGAALLVSLMMVLFTGLVLLNAYRGLNIACGCFSLSAREPSNLAVNTLRNLALLAAALWVLYGPKREWLPPAQNRL